MELWLRVPLEGTFMPKATCIQNVTFGATGVTYDAGEVYDVPADILTKYAEYFKKKAGRPKTKQSATEENK